MRHLMETLRAKKKGNRHIPNLKNITKTYMQIFILWISPEHKHQESAPNQTRWESKRKEQPAGYCDQKMFRGEDGMCTGFWGRDRISADSWKRRGEDRWAPPGGRWTLKAKRRGLDLTLQTTKAEWEILSGGRFSPIGLRWGDHAGASEWGRLEEAQEESWGL